MLRLHGQVHLHCLPLLTNSINILAGTGSMAISRNEEGQIIRCGGWSEFFSDEGSCYWLGIKALELFSKQADGRAEKSHLYKLIKDYNKRNFRF